MKACISLLMFVVFLSASCSGGSNDPQNIILEAAAAIQKKEYAKASKYFALRGADPLSKMLAVAAASSLWEVVNKDSVKFSNIEIDGNTAKVDMEISCMGRIKTVRIRLVEQDGWKIVPFDKGY